MPLSFNSTAHASGKCQQFFQPLSKSHRQATKAIKASKFKTLEKLIENNKINLQWKHPFNKSTLLHLAAQYSKDSRIIETLATGIDINSQDSKGNTALHAAIDSKNIIASEVLLEFNTSLAIQNEDGETALHTAIRTLNVSAVKALVTQIDKQDTMTELFSISNKDKETIYSYGSSSYFNLEKLSKEEENALNEINFLIKNTKSEVKKMEEAIKASDLKTLKRLIEGKKIDPKRKHFFNKSTLLHLAARHSKYPGFIKAIIKTGVDINHQDEDGKTALHLAVEFNSESVSRVILNAGGDLKIKNKKGKTALHLAVELNNEHLVRLFMQYESFFPTIKDEDGNTALHLAVKNKNLNLVRLFIQHSSFFPVIKNDKGDTALHIAIKEGLKDIAKALIEAKAPLHITNKEGETPLDYLKTLPDMLEIYNMISANQKVLK